MTVRLVCRLSRPCVPTTCPSAGATIRSSCSSILRVTEIAAARPDTVRTVYDHLAGDEPTHTPDELTARVDRPVGDDLGALETLVFARLLRALAE